MRTRRATIRDVGKAAGVSLGTASRALNRSGMVNKAAVAATTDAAQGLGYEPDAIAQSMRRRSTGVLGMPDVKERVPESGVTAAFTAGEGARRERFRQSNRGWVYATVALRDGLLVRCVRR